VASTPGEDFARVIALARTELEQVEVTQEIDTERAILTIMGQRPPYRIFIKETISARGRRYAYYILADDRVLLGLDNHADRQALRLRYGDDFAAHLTELIPHQHNVDKTSLILTEEWTAEQFLNELERLIAEIESL
jgi:hypothetical protein